MPRADGDREALRILLVARQEITVTAPPQASRPLPLWPGANSRLRPAVSTPCARPRSPLALALTGARQQLKANRQQLLAIVSDIALGLTSRYGAGPLSAAQAIVSFSHPGRCRNEAAYGHGRPVTSPQRPSQHERASLRQRAGAARAVAGVRLARPARFG